ncbi:MAG: YhbY family RNA-binding protein [Nanoarchaeota archaeon]
MTQSTIQLGKKGVTENFIGTLNVHFKNYDNVKVHVLKNAEHKKEKLIEYRNKILEKLGNNYTARIVGFTIFVKKWRRAVR